ncbi:MAG: peptide-binding protein, partial [Candidatus Omnitrophica bacterium]|nr:peptide-binding protein [Candidatus Omnitrophota bacterium]
MPRILFAAFFIFCSAEVFCAQPPSGPTFVSASIAEPATLLPVLASDSASHEVIGKVFNGLVRYNPDLMIEPELAESWAVSEDGKEIRFFLRKNIRWHDGTPFTSADVEFTYRTLINPDVPTPYSGDFQKVSKLTVVNDYELTVTYAEPFAPALASWGIWMLPKHLLANENLLHTDFARHPVGTGPYTFRKWKSGQSVELRANKDYFEGAPQIERLIYRVIPDQTTMFMELHQQTVDSIGLTPIQ